MEIVRNWDELPIASIIWKKASENLFRKRCCKEEGSKGGRWWAMDGPLSSLGWWNLISLKIGRRCFEAKTNVPSAGTTGGGGGGQSG